MYSICDYFLAERRGFGAEAPAQKIGQTPDIRLQTSGQRRMLELRRLALSETRPSLSEMNQFVRNETWFIFIFISIYIYTYIYLYIHIFIYLYI